MVALITPDNVLDRLGREFTTTEDAVIDARIADVSASIRAYTGREFTVGETTALLRPFGRVVKLPQRPVTAINAVEDRYGNTITYTWIDGDPELHLGAGWYLNAFELNVAAVGSLDRVRVTWEHGYETVPDDVIAVACNMVIRALAVPAEDGGITSETIGSYSYQRTNVAATSIWAPDRTVLDRYRIPTAPALMLT